MEHPAEACLTQVLVTDPGGHGSRGSGYRVARGWVLTAAHVVQKSARIAVWSGAPTELRGNEGVAVDPALVRIVQELDLALLPVPDTTVEPGFVAPAFGVLDRDSSVQVPAVAVGFPWFKLRPVPGRAGVELRDVHYATALVVGGSNLRTGTLAFPVTEPPPERHSDPLRSPWEGMSGAAVFAAGYLVGVVGQHHPRDGLGTLTVRSLQLPPGNDLGLSPDMLHRWGEVLPQLRLKLPAVQPPTSRELAARRAQRTAASLAPPVLVGRQADLARLAEFCIAGQPPWRWVQAPAFSGKTALLAWFALHPPESVDVAACFLQMTTADNTASYALTVLNSQLAALVGRAQYQPPAEIPDRISDFLDDLLPAAATRGQQLGCRLLLVVDGLDEYSQEETRPLRAWLPDAANLPAGVSVLVSSRAGIPIPLPDGHPLCFYVDQVASSAAAAELRALAAKELHDAVKAEPELRYEILACLAACGGISTEGLQMWLARRGHRVLAGYLGAQITRWYHRTVRVAEDPDGLTGDTLAFAHDTLREAAEEIFDKSIAQLRDELHAWAEECRGKSWPADTPLHLLTVYPRLLTQTRDTARLTALALDGLRHDRMFTLTGGDAAALDEIRTAQALLLAANDPDLLSMSLLARHRDHLAIRNWSMPPDLPGLWATLGHPNRALATARAILDPEPRARAFTVLVQDLAASGDKDNAVKAAELARAASTMVTTPSQQSELLSALVDALAAAHEFHLAQNTATTITNRDDQARALAKVTMMSAAAGEHDVARGSAAMITNRRARADAYAALVGALADEGNYELARSIASTTSYRDARVQALATLVKALGHAGQYDQAAELAALARRTAVKIVNPEARAIALTSVVEGLAACGDTVGAVDAAELAKTVASKVADPWQQSHLLTRLACAVAGTREHQSGAPLVNRAVAIATTITEPRGQAGALTTLATTLADIGNRQGAAQAAALAQKTASAIADPGTRAGALTNLLKALAAAGEQERAALVADLAEASAAATEPPEQTWAIIQLSNVLDDAGEPGRAAQVIARLPKAIGTTRPGQIGSSEFGLTRPATVTTLVSALVRVGYMDRAIRLAHFARYASSFGEAWVYRALLQALSAVGEDDVADAMIRALPDASETYLVFVNDDALADLTRALVGAGEYVLAENVARSAREPGRFHHDLVADLAAINENERAEAIATTIADPYWKAITVTNLATALAASDPEHAAQLADLARTTAATLHPLRQSRALTALAKALAAVGDHRRAAELADLALRTAAAIPQPLRQSRALTALAKALAAVGDHRRAAELAELAWTTGVATSRWNRGRALVAAVEGLAAAGALERAQEHATALTDHERKQAFTALIDALATSERERACIVATSVSDPYWKALALTAVANALASDDRVRAGELADLAYTTATTVSDRNTQANLLTAMAASFAASGEYDRAQAVAASITRPSARARALISLVQALAAGDQESRTRVAELAQTAATRIKSPRVRAEALAALAQPLATAGDHHRATRLARLAHTTATSITYPSIQARALADLAPALVAAGEYELAQAIASSIGDANWKRKALIGLTSAFAAAGEYDRANAAATSITGPRTRAEAMTGLVEALAATNNQPKHELALTTAMTIADPYWKALAVTAVARAFTADGDRERVRQLAGLALATASNTEPGERDRVLASLTQMLATAGEYERGLTTATKITDPDRQAKALTVLATVMTRKSDIRNSRQALAQAWAVGKWEIPLPALAEIDAEVLQQLAEAEVPQESQ
jgi:tetratricopeptide (TPR) repeat protein